MRSKSLLSVLLCALLLCGATLAEGYNTVDLYSYALCLNSLAAESGVPAILWDVSVHVNRAELKVNFPEYVEGIMAGWPQSRTVGNGGDDAVFEEETAREAADRFGPGFNLGNTLDANSYDDAAAEPGWIVLWGAKDSKGKVKPSAFETAWGQPVTTQEIADYVLSLGFGVVRIPVTWAEHLDENNRVDEAWMARVKEVVDYFYRRGVYCIVNVHHDGGANGWIKATEAAYEKYSGRFADLWTQIANAFADYDERLLFESMNEVLDDKANWGSPSADAAKWINAWNQLFVDTVRMTGGNNARRNLLVMTYAGGGSEGNLAPFVLPADSAENHLMVTVHNYDPQGFTWTNATWTKMTAVWDEKAHGDVLRAAFATYCKYAEQLGVPFVLGEYNADPKLYADYDK